MRLCRGEVGSIRLCVHRAARAAQRHYQWGIALWREAKKSKKHFNMFSVSNVHPYSLPTLYFSERLVEFSVKGWDRGTCTRQTCCHVFRADTLQAVRQVSGSHPTGSEQEAWKGVNTDCMCVGLVPTCPTWCIASFTMGIRSLI